MKNFSVSGNPITFRNLAETRMSTFFNISGGIDHYHDCPNDDFRLASCLFDTSSIDDYEIWQLGHELVSLYNAIGNIFSIDPQLMSLLDLYTEDKREYCNDKIVNSTYSIFDACKKSDKDSFLSEIIKLKESPLIYLCILIASLKREDIYLILKQLNGLNTQDKAPWAVYYKIKETIINLAKLPNVNITLNFDKKKMSALGYMSNNYSQTGLNSRHGYVGGNNPSNNVINIEEAHDLVADMAKQYINILLNKIINNQADIEFSMP